MSKMEFTSLLELAGRDGHTISDTINLFLNSKKEVIIRHSYAYGWISSKYKFKAPSTMKDVADMIKVADSVHRCESCRTIWSEVETDSCPRCLLTQMVNCARTDKGGTTMCTICNSKCIPGMVGKTGKTKLLCGHELCNGCMTGLKKNGTRFYDTDNGIATRITCPFCRNEENVS